MACAACHASKVKCVMIANTNNSTRDTHQTTSCQRCLKLDIPCLPHESKQGKWTKTKAGVDRKMIDTTPKNNARRKRPAASWTAGIITSRSRTMQSYKKDCADVLLNGGSSQTWAIPDAASAPNNRAIARDPILPSNKRSRPGFVDPNVVTETTVTDASASFFSNTHFGLYANARKWMAIAIRRRSVKLLSRAFALAHKCGISMDDLFCATIDRYGTNIPSSCSTNVTGSNSEEVDDDNVGSLLAAMGTGQHSDTTSSADALQSLVQLLLLPGPQQQVIGSRIDWSEIPNHLIEAMYPTLSSPIHPENRWIYGREVKAGVARFFTSAAFERDICSYKQIAECWTSNTQGEVKDLWTTREEDKYKYSLGLVHIILKSCPSFGCRPEPTQLSDMHLKLHSSAGEQVVLCHVVICSTFTGYDHNWFLSEYHSPQNIDDRWDDPIDHDQAQDWNELILTPELMDLLEQLKNLS